MPELVPSEHPKMLHQAVADAYASVQTAQSDYEQSAAVLRDVDDPLNLDGVVAVRKTGLDYAAAVLRYSDAVMAWVGYMDSHLPAAKKKSRLAAE